MVETVFAMIYDLYIRFWLINSIFILLRLRKKITKIIFILIFDNRKIFSKNFTLSAISVTEKSAIIMSNVSRIE